MKTQSIITLVLFIGCIVLGILYFNAKKELDFLNTLPKNTYSRWSESQETLGSYWRNNDKLQSLAIDKNFDDNFEFYSMYDVHGKLFQSSYDEDEDGVYERGESFNILGDLVGNYSDGDQDGRIDRFMLVLDNQTQLDFFDTDADGRYEKIMIKDSIRTTGVTITALLKQF
jgi:hypothetical protein